MFKQQLEKAQQEHTDGVRRALETLRQAVDAHDLGRSLVASGEVDKLWSQIQEGCYAARLMMVNFYRW